ncbi:MAG: hypothetical protein ABRQ37_02535, partial [Candidatus Eremiobacterota bacterium]
DTSKKFSVGDSVFLQIPVGDKQQTKIVARSNIKIPDEELYEYGEEPVEEGTIYLSCPEDGDGLIKVYTLDGTPGTDISPGSNALYNIIYAGEYLYFSHGAAYSVHRIKLDGTGYQQIVMQGRYYNASGLAINSTGTYLYTAYTTWEPSYGIAKINISTGEVEETDITSVFFDEIADLCGDGTYLYLLGRSMRGTSRIAVYDFNLNFIREISTGGIYSKIAADGTNLYLTINDVEAGNIEVRTTTGNFVQSISCTGTRAIGVNDSNIYAVTQSKVKKYNSSGVFQSEFEVEGTVEDCVII